MVKDHSMGYVSSNCIPVSVLFRRASLFEENKDKKVSTLAEKEILCQMYLLEIISLKTIIGF